MATTLSRDELLDAIGNMTVLELSEFVKAFEEKFGVTAAAPVAVAAGPAAGGGAAAPAAEEKTEFDVVLQGAGVDGAPKPVKEGVSKEEAEQIKAKLEEQGASVELK